MSLNLNAKQSSIKSLFEKNFRIPVYQRAYSWTEEQCEKLINDLISYFEAEDFNDSYFLGNIVLAKGSNNDIDIWDIVDGQQRLITLSLLLRELYNHDIRNRKLKECIYDVDSRDEDIIKGYKIISHVLGDKERALFENCLQKNRGGDDLPNDRHYGANYRYFQIKIDELKQKYKLEDFIDCVLDKVSLLPIECDNADKALTIFETINNRGLDLSDGDIFKSKLYQMAKGSETQFIEKWDNIIEKLSLFKEKFKLKDSSPITSLFRIYMHLLRAENDDKTKTVKLRDFFEGKVMDSSKKRTSVPKYRLEKMDWKNVLTSLENIFVCWENIYSCTYVEIPMWYKVLSIYGNDNTLYPVIIYLYKNIDFSRETDLLPKSKKQDIIFFIKNIARYVYSKGFDATVEGSTIDDKMSEFSINAAANSPILYEPKIKIEFINRLKDKIPSSRFRRGFITIIALINKKQECTKLNLDTADVEHILPKKWDNNFYDVWDQEKVSEAMDTLGNLLLLEKAKNIKGSNAFFSKKCEEAYKDSKFIEAKDLASRYTQWTYENYIDNHERSAKLIKEFLEGKK